MSYVPWEVQEDIEVNCTRIEILAFALFMSLLGGQAAAQTATDLNCTACVGTGDLAAGSVTTNKIANGGVRTPDLGANSVTSGKIKDGNVNFVDLSPDIQAFLGAAIADISTQGASASDYDVVGVVCPSGTIAVSANCACDNDGGDSNFGVLFGCGIAGNGAIAACFNDGLTYSPLLNDPVAQVEAVCLGATSADGTPWVPTFTGLAADIEATGGDAAQSTPDIAQWHASQQAAFESKLRDTKNRNLLYRTHISTR